MRLARFAAIAAALLACVSVAHAAPAALKVPDTMAERVQACTACHGKEGRATPDGYFPRIAGKPAGYLFNQLVNFRDGRRHNAAMTHLVDHLSDAYLREIAGYFAALDLPYPPPAQTAPPASVLQHGQALVMHGDAQRRIPACTQCHGARMTGVEPAIPGLLGLPRDYLIGQFGGWRTGQRKAAAPDCMARISALLTPDDINAVAAWLSSRAVPVDAKPVASMAGPPPMRCGTGLE